MKKKYIILILILIFSIFVIIYLENMKPNEEQFLKQNSEEVISNRDITLIDKNMSQKDIFLVGETHAITQCEELYIKFLKYFKANENIKYIILEAPPSHALILNDYLKSGDEKILETLKMFYIGAYGVTEGNFQNYREIYKLNSSLEDSKKMKFIGIDTEKNIELTVYSLRGIIDKYKTYDMIDTIESEIDNIEHSINAPNGTNGMEQANLAVDNILQHIDKEDENLKKLLGEDYFVFKTIVENLKNTIDVLKGEYGSELQGRDIIMYENFIKFHNNLEDGKYFGQFGLDHVFQEDIGNQKYFASLLNKEMNSPFQDKVVSIACMLNDVENRSNTSQYMRELISSSIKSDITLFKLIGEESPFEDAPYKDFLPIKTLERVTGNYEINKPLSNYFQYMIFIRNPSYSTPVS